MEIHTKENLYEREFGELAERHSVAGLIEKSDAAILRELQQYCWIYIQRPACVNIVRSTSGQL